MTVTMKNIAIAKRLLLNFKIILLESAGYAGRL